MWSKGKSTSGYPLFKDYENSENSPNAGLPTMLTFVYR